MSGIEEALDKLRASRPGEYAETPQRLGRVLPTRGPFGEAPHVYGGRQIKLETLQTGEKLFASERRDKRLEDEFRSIKRPLLTNLKTREPVLQRGNVWAIVSALAGEGKTFVAINLALSIARERDWNVVLVDGDCARRHITQLVGADEEPGLMDLVTDTGLTFDSMVMPTSIRGLAVLPAGTHNEHAAEFFASVRMDQLCESASGADQRRIVIFDTPPMFTTEAPALAAHSGQVVVVVQANKTPQKAVLDALERIEPSKAVSVVLNQAESIENAYGAVGAYK
jgi:Mrp family chromosome partitioning ATPase